MSVERQSATAARPATATETHPDARALRAWWTEAWSPVTKEETYEITDVEGEMPRELHGTLYRNGPSQVVLPEEGYHKLHLFDGDGLVNGFRFDNGRLHYRGRFVKDASYLREQKLGRYHPNGVNVGLPPANDEFIIRQQHNTNVVYHAEKLLALVENAYPFEMDPRTLDSIGDYVFDKPMVGYSVSAHPKIDGRTGQMVIHGYQWYEPYLQLYVIEPDGTCSLAEGVDAPYSVMMHDMAISQNHAIFPLAPIMMDGNVLMGGGTLNDALSWDREKPLRFGVRPRSAGGEVRWFDAPSSAFFFHSGNAYEENGKIYIDACTYQDPDNLLDGIREWRTGKMNYVDAVPYLYELDLKTGECREKQLSDRGAEFPRIDDRLVGHPNRFGYAVVARREAGNPYERVLGCIQKYDRRGGPSACHDFGIGQWTSEPVFVPRAPDAAEDDGFVLSVVYDGATRKSFVAVLDARNIEGKPLAKAHLRHRMPMGFHGNYAHGVV